MSAPATPGLLSRRGGPRRGPRRRRAGRHGTRSVAADALGRVIAEAVTARVSLPPWPNSAMDGYAIRRRRHRRPRPRTPRSSCDVIGDVARRRAAPDVDRPTRDRGPDRDRRPTPRRRRRGRPGRGDDPARRGRPAGPARSRRDRARSRQRASSTRPSRRVAPSAPRAATCEAGADPRSGRDAVDAAAAVALVAGAGVERGRRPPPPAGRGPRHRRRGPRAGPADSGRPGSPTRTARACARSSTAAGADADRPRDRRRRPRRRARPVCVAASTRAPTRSSSRAASRSGPYDVVKTAIETDRPDRPLAGRRPARQAVRLRRRRTRPGGGAPVLLVRPARQPGLVGRHLRAVRPPRDPAPGRPARTCSGRSIARSSASRSRKSHGRRAFLRVVAERDDDRRPGPRRAGPRPRPPRRAGRGATSSRPWPPPTPSRSSPRPMTALPAGRRGRAVVARPRMMDARLTADPTTPGGPMDPTIRRPRAERRRLTHVDRAGRPRMVDVSDKPVDGAPRRRRGDASRSRPRR